MSIDIGDRIQIVNGGIDVTNGASAKAGVHYGSGGPLWATIDLIQPNWNTGGRFGLPPTVTKVRCISDSGIVVWQIQPKDVSTQVIKTSKPNLVQTSPNIIPFLEQTKSGINDLMSSVDRFFVDPMKITFPGTTDSIPVKNIPIPELLKTQELKTQMGSHSVIGDGKNISYESRYISPSGLGGVHSSILFDGDIRQQKMNTAFSNPAIRREMLDEDIENIQNSYKFPIRTERAQNNITAKYDYQVRVGDPKLPLMVTLENKLRDARSSLGIPVHGRNDVARAMKYYMYNRFKTPDINMVHNKSITHIFFTRPDLNLLRHINVGGKANRQVRNHSEAMVLWRKNPDLFKLLTNFKRCGDMHNFNLLLSNQVTSFDIQDEQLNTIESGRSWAQYEMVYGDSYTGRAAGEFSCNFVETNDYSIINLIKLWITYIDNVAKGAWSPSYNLLGGDGVSTSYNASHVYSKTLDYASDAYVFKCGPDGEDVLYWSKYYGVFPVNTGASSLSWDIGQPTGDAPRPSIRFKYTFKRDMSPISLIEFNKNANINNDTKRLESYNYNVAHSSRPYVGAPFIEMKLSDPGAPSRSGGASLGPSAPKSSIRLKFRANTENRLTDDDLYRTSMTNR